MILENRVKYSFAVSIGFHLLVLWFFGYISVKDKQDIKLITNIELIEPVIPGAPPGPKEEKPKNIWEFMKMAIPTIKKPEPGPKDDKPVDVVRKEVDKAIDIEKKLVEKEAPIIRKVEALKFKELERNRDQKLAEISKTMDKAKFDKLVEQVRLADKEEPMARKTADPLKFDEVGLKRDDKIKDVMSTADAGSKTDAKLRDLTPSDLLTDKKAPIDKGPKADEFGIKLKTREKSDAKVFERIGTAEEVKKVREYLAVKDQLVERAPTRVAGGGGGGSGAGRPAIGYGGGGISFSKNEELKKVETKVNIAPVKKSEAAAQEKVEAKSSAMELIGPLKGRGVIAAYMPKYPSWMEEKGIEASASVRFFVAPNGSVKESGMSLETTSGYSELDKAVMAVLKTWQFEALPKSVKQEDQWGVVTFRFRLKK